MKQMIDKPSPVTGGKLELCIEPATVVYRGETIPYDRSCYRCVDSGMEFTDEELEKVNLKLIYDTYRRRHGIPTAKELKGMRERYGLPSSAMSLILGLGENQYALYEDGVVPTPSVGRLLSLARDSFVMKEMLMASHNSFSDKLYGKYYKAISESMLPARYENEEISVIDFGFYAPFPPSLITNNTASSSRKRAYNEYEYAAAI